MAGHAGSRVRHRHHHTLLNASSMLASLHTRRAHTQLFLLQPVVLCCRCAGQAGGDSKRPSKANTCCCTPCTETPGAGPTELKRILHASLNDTNWGVGPEEGHQLSRVPSSLGWQCWRRAGLSGDDLLGLLGPVHSLFLRVTSVYWLPSHFLSCIPLGSPLPAQTSVRHVPLATMAQQREPCHLPGTEPGQHGLLIWRCPCAVTYCPYEHF